MGDVDGPGVLRINYFPYTSSLYPTTELLEDLTLYIEGYDYRLNQAARTMEYREVELRRIDTLAEIRDGHVPPPAITASHSTTARKFRKCETAGRPISKLLAISPTVDAPWHNSAIVWRRVGSARALNTTIRLRT